MEHKGLYRQGFAAEAEPDSEYLLEFGKAKLIETGDQITIVTWGAIVQKSKEAVRLRGVSADIIDLRTLNPVDMKTIIDSVKKTNRLLITHEDNITGGFGAELSARIADRAFEYLDAPIKRVASLDSPIAYSSILENELLVQTKWIEDAIEELITY